MCFSYLASTWTKRPKITSHLCSRHVLSQGLQVSCRVSPSSLVGTWAAAVVWLSFRMSWMWNDSLSDAECYTSRISYPWKQMLVSHRGLLFWRKNNMRTCDVMCELEESYHLKIKKTVETCIEMDKKKTTPEQTLFVVYSSVITLYAFYGSSQWAWRLQTGWGDLLGSSQPSDV